MRITGATARRILRRQGMPSREIHAVLASDDPLLVRRRLELHRERLEEWLEEQQRLVASIEASLVDEPGAPLSDPKTFRDPQLDRTPVVGPHSCLGWGTR